MHDESAPGAAEDKPSQRPGLKSFCLPRASRYAADQLLWLVRADGSISCATMINVSRRGFGLRVSCAPASGERVVIRGGAGDIPAEIRWTDGDRAGGLFVRPDDQP
jgi:hypothetical protein